MYSPGLLSEPADKLVITEAYPENEELQQDTEI